QSPVRAEGGVFSPDGRALAFREDDDTLCLWDTAMEKPLGRLEHPKSNYIFSPDGKTLVTGGTAERICLWEAATGKLRRRFPGSGAYGTLVRAFSPDGKTLVAGTDSGQLDPAALRLWDVETDRERRPFGGHAAAVSCLAYAPDGRTLASGGRDHTLRI